MTQLQQAKAGTITTEMKNVARDEGVDGDWLMKQVAAGEIVIPANRNHKNLAAVGIGGGLKVKVNSNIGTSPLFIDVDDEMAKLEAALTAGADAVMDLSTGGDLDEIRRRMIAACPKPLGTVPMYQVMKEAGDKTKMSMSIYMDVLKRHAEQGVDFITIHAGVTSRAFGAMDSRLMKSVSRGGALLLAWMAHHNKESFIYENFDDVLGLCKDYDITLSLGDGMRPGCLHDATDQAQLDELRILGELQQRAVAEGVQVMIEGPGHVPYNEIELNVILQKKYCHKAPFYVLGPLPTDIAAGYDHIACAMGGALAASKGADFLCYVTPKEHIGLPNVGDVYQGTVVTKIAAHVADLARGNPAALARDHRMAVARNNVDWIGMQEESIDPVTFAELRRLECEQNPELDRANFCSMCGDFCVFESYNPDKKEKGE